jgi:hypothetical protein
MLDALPQFVQFDAERRRIERRQNRWFDGKE